MIRIRIKRVHISMRKKRIVSLVTALVLLCAPISPSMFALGDGPSEYLCGHVHNETCGWVEGCEASPCTHEHDENCYVETQHCQHACDHVCTHVCDDACTAQELTCPHVCGEECYVRVQHCLHVCGAECYVSVHACGESCYAQEHHCTHTHDEGCYVQEHRCIHTHDAGCYVSVPHCAHIHDANCGGLCEHVCGPDCNVKELSCPHVHDESCGYIEAVSAAPCSHVCEILSFERHTPGVAIDSYTAGAGDSASRISNALPDTLLGTLACTGGSANIPVRWKTAGYHGEAGTYVFRAELTSAHCVYAASDIPETQDVDESEMPFIAVIVPEAEVEAEADAASEIPSVPSIDVSSFPAPETSAELAAEPAEEPVCGCTEHCGEDCVNPDCTVCAEHPENCTGRIIGDGFPQTGRVHAEGAEAEVDGLIQPMAIDTALTLYNESDGRYEFSSAEIETGYIAKELVTLDAAEEPVCGCTEHCGEDCANPDCPVCAEHPENCTGRNIGEGFPQTGRVHAEGAEAEVDGLMQPMAIDTALTLYNESDGRYEFSSAEIETGYIAKELVTLDVAEEPVCCCTEPCGEDCVNPDCPVCSEQGWGACAIKVMSAQTLSVTAEDGSTVAVSGELPAGVTLSVSAVAIETAAAFVDEGATILFAYDIQLFVAGVEWQPAPESPLTVTVTPPEPIETPVTVTHVLEDAETGTATPETISGVTTTAEGTVEFPAEGFSVYIITLTPNTVTFNYDDAVLDVEYCTTIDGIYTTLSGDYSVGASSELYFKVSGGINIFVWRDGVQLAAAGGTYALDDIKTELVIDISESLTFDLFYGNVVIGTAGQYSGYIGENKPVTGSHDNANQYVVMQSNSAVTSNQITLIGNSSIPIYTVTLRGVNCATSENKSKGGIVAEAVSGTPMHIVLRLEGSNSVGRVHYATGEANLTSSSSLLITSASGDGSTAGSLTAVSSVEWAAAIGGIDDTVYEASRNITIAGGTIIATGKSSAAIGGGGNGYSDVRITGGSVTATSTGTGAAIGGGGGLSLAGGGGYVTISGGTVNATNKSLNGVAIGGGGSEESTGSVSTVTITGGVVTVSGNIGGGSSIQAAGGAATVTISGGRVSATGSIGGGNSTNGTGGVATIAISGGTITAANISGGHGVGGSHAGGTLNVTGGSAKVDHVCSEIETTGIGGAVIPYTVVVSNGTAGVANAPVTAIVFNPPLGSAYGLSDVRTDAEGKLYLWIPSSIAVNSVTAGGTEYPTGNIVQKAASITPNELPVVAGTVLTADLSGDTAIEWKWQRYTAGIWTDIPGANSGTYTAQPADAGHQLLVVINGSVYSPPIAVGAPSFTVTIPASVNMDAANFNILAVHSGFLTGQSLNIAVRSVNNFMLRQVSTNSRLSYKLYTDAEQQSPIANGGKVATFTGSGTSNASVYYGITGTPTYSGAYTDTLTFTVTFKSGS